MSRPATMVRWRQIGAFALAVAKADDLEEPAYGR